MPSKKTKTKVTVLTNVKRQTNICFAIDVSGSMKSLEESLTTAVNSMLDTLRVQDPDAMIAVVTFGEGARMIQSLSPISNMKNFPRFSCNEGSTALFDGIGVAAESIDTGDKEHNYLVMGFTDGGENSSRKFRNNIKEFIKQKESLDNWTFTIQLSPGDKASFQRQFGLSEGNLREWEATQEGVTQLTNVTNSSIQGYYTAMASGQRSVKNFYSMTTDLSQVKTGDLKKALVDQKSQFKAIKVDKEADIRPFVEGKTGVPYKKGTAYYQLTKPEKVQPNKDVLIMEKGKSSIWGGMPGRALVGLPTDGVTYSKVNPGNHANYDIFVKSNSVNRKLVRGTTLLVKV